MVVRRLPRESNPIPGQSQPGFVPAFDETGNEDYVRVSNQKPYPVANYTQNASGVWLPTSQNNPMPTQLTGSIVAENKVGEPRLIATIDYSDLTVGSVLIKRIIGQLKPQAKKRSFIIESYMDVVLKKLSIGFFDSRLGENYLRTEYQELLANTSIYTS